MTETSEFGGNFHLLSHLPVDLFYEVRVVLLCGVHDVLICVSDLQPPSPSQYPCISSILQGPSSTAYEQGLNLGMDKSKT